MKTKIIALVLIAAVQASWCQPAQEVAKPGTSRRIDPLAMQMQMAVLTTRDTNAVANLLKRGVNINAPIGCGTYSPLDGAVDTENLEMLKFLLAHGAKPQGRELEGAAFFDNPETAMDFVKVLLSAGANPNATNNLGSTPLTSAAYQGHQDLVSLLLAQPGIMVDAQDASGYTALMYAAQHGSLGIVDLLLKAGADPNLKNDRGETAADLAEQGIATRRAIISKLKSKAK